MNPNVTAFMRNFVNEVKRCDEMERKLRFLVDELLKEDDYEELASSGVVAMGGSPNITLDQLEQRLEQEEAELNAANNSAQILERNRNELLELKHVLEKDQLFFQDAGALDEEDDGRLGGGRGGGGREDAPLLGEGQQDDDVLFAKASTNLGFITGVVEEDKFLSFERILWRATRGNVYVRHTEVDEPLRDVTTSQLIHKYVFIIFFQGSRVEHKIRKICEAFKANLYPCPGDPNERRALLTEVSHRLHEVELVLKRGVSVRQAVLRRVALEIPSWQEKLRREKAIFNTMNMMDYDHGRKCLIANGWCPVRETPTIQQALRKGVQRTGSAVPSIMSVVPTHEVPPTYFRTNKFTEVFQDMVDAYGVANYGEINPAVFSIATFPFLFAVMYGDVGHGLLMLLGIIPMLVWDQKCKQIAATNEIFGLAYAGRYLLLMMALAAIYTGFLYNEFFSIPMDIFGSSWSHENCGAPDGPWVGKALVNVTNALCKVPRTYPFGVDPAFRGAANELLFSNSLKMKMSIVLGVIHMSVGIFMHLLNGIKFRKWYNVFCEFVPQILFMWCMFGYLVALIVYKWSQDYSYYVDYPPIICNNVTQSREAPSLIGVMISMALPFFNGISCEQMEGMFGLWMKTLQTALLLIAFICIPWMLILKPILLWNDNRRGIHDPDHHGETFQFGEVFVHQMIHSIEFILGTVSNTASYLRLWALSLAHSELSIVFYEKALVGVGMSLSSSGSPIGFIAFFITWAVWAGVTVGVLVVMEALSAFLHALRLHWVEFQNKFYLGSGRKFAPFSFAALAAAVPPVEKPSSNE